jgi:hypothetical protein
MRKSVMVLVVLAAACGGKKHGDTAEGGGGPTIDTHADSGDPTDHSGNMIPPEKMDEVNNALKRKQMIISRCLADAVETKEVPKATHGKITLELTISPDGHATNVKVVKSSIDSQVVQGCVKRHVEEIGFPQIPRQYETSYTYSMEAN